MSHLMYATINEAWGDLEKKTKRRKNQDPICDLYEQREFSPEQNIDEDADMLRYARANKSKYQKNMKTDAENYPE